MTTEEGQIIKREFERMQQQNIARAKSTRMITKLFNQLSPSERWRQLGIREV